MDSKLDKHSQRPDRRRFLAGIGTGLGVSAASVFAQNGLEYEDGPWDGVEGAKDLIAK